MKRIALLGMPNSGKSTLFNRLTGARARVGNWPGVTVDLTSARILIGGHMVELVDLPGIYDLRGLTEDERVATEFLSKHPVDLLLVVLNATQIDRQLGLAVEAASLGVPVLVLLNMADEAARYGVEIDVPLLSRKLDLPMVKASAKYGDGMPEASRLMARLLDGAEPARAARIDLQRLQEPAIEAAAEAALAAAVRHPIMLSGTLTDRIDRFALHPWLGPVLFVAALYLVFKGVFVLGQPLQTGVTAILDAARAAWLAPALHGLPAWARGLLLDGVYGGLSTVAAFVPLIVLFFFFMALVEDSGYLSRAAFLVDSWMSRLGLDGRSFVMLLMGFGCNVPALMGTRIMRSRALRLLTMLTIPLSLCSARLQVFLFIIAAVFPAAQAPWALVSLYLVSIAAAVLTALLFKGRFTSNEPFVLELPPYRLPTVSHVVLRGWQEVRHFLHRATRFIVAGVVLVWLLTNLPLGAASAGPDTWAGTFGRWLDPLLSPAGIDQRLAVALLFGFVAKEVMIGAMAVIFAAQGDALSHVLAQQMDLTAAYSFMLFTLLYTPCLSTVATLRQESRSVGYTVLAVAWPLVLAWGVAVLFYQGARALGF